MFKQKLPLRLYVTWMILLVVIPLITMIVLMFTTTDGASLSGAVFTLDNFKKLFDPVYVQAYVSSIQLSFIATLICLIIAYPVSYVIANMKSKYRGLLLILIILPMWSNMLLRIVGWETLFFEKSLLNMFGISLDLIGTNLAVIIGMVSMYLPFMIFPIYTVLDRMDKSLLEASQDLGATKLQTFLKVTLPLSLPGIFSGAIMTFLPSATNFVLPQRLAGGNIVLIGNLIETQFKKAYNFNLGSLLSIVLIAIIFIAMYFINKVDDEGDLLF